MSKSRLGVMALTCAAVDDVTAWCLLALVVGVVQAAAGRALLVTALALAFIGVMFMVVRPLCGAARAPRRRIAIPCGAPSR